ncbi:MAG TPA: LON peptidase substrate-binding domain-containing protein [Gaiellaceae bacterium]|nr:LON peptidase substrate-binding domain-containing protein [Gaiellaceae bacterium]
MDELGLFPLGIVLLPTEQLPLHIFEERYKELIAECLESDGEFGLVYADDDGLRDLGTRARVTEVLTRFEDGRLNVLVEGGGRFRLTELTDGRSFNTGLVSSIVDDDDPAEAPVVEEALRLFELLREITGSEVEAPGSDLPQLSYSLAGKVELPADDKLGLLGETSERVRMELVQDILSNAVLTAQRVRRAAERAATNGRVDLG